MTVVLALALDFEINSKRIGKLFAFNASHISFVVQVVYYWITSVGFIPATIFQTLSKDASFSFGLSSIFYGHALGSLKAALLPL